MTTRRERGPGRTAPDRDIEGPVSTKVVARMKHASARRWSVRAFRYQFGDGEEIPPFIWAKVKPEDQAVLLHRGWVEVVEA
jgi:hypothetical protein